MWIILNKRTRAIIEDGCELSNHIVAFRTWSEARFYVLDVLPKAVEEYEIYKVNVNV